MIDFLKKNWAWLSLGALVIALLSLLPIDCKDPQPPVSLEPIVTDTTKTLRDTAEYTTFTKKRVRIDRAKPSKITGPQAILDSIDKTDSSEVRYHVAYDTLAGEFRDIDIECFTMKTHTIERVNTEKTVTIATKIPLVTEVEVLDWKAIFYSTGLGFLIGFFLHLAL